MKFNKYTISEFDLVNPVVLYKKGIDGLSREHFRFIRFYGSVRATSFHNALKNFVKKRGKYYGNELGPVFKAKNYKKVSDNRMLYLLKDEDIEYPNKIRFISVYKVETK